MQLLDRQRELETLSAALERATAGQGSIALVTGEAGIGKTSLLQTFISSISDQTRLLRGACEDLRVAEPLGPIQTIVREADPRLAAALSDADKPFAIYSDVVSLLSDHSTATLVLIEDLHWADDATLDFVRFLARRIAEHPILLAVSSRAERAENRQMVRRTFGDVPPEILHRLPLGSLSVAAVAELCKSSTRSPEKIFQASGGNPFYVTELLRNQNDDLPLSIQDAVLARADRLGGAARLVLECASAFPRRAEIETVATVLGSDIDVEAGIEDCLDAGLLITDGEYLAFQHEIARQAVVNSVSQLKLRALHRKLLAALSSQAEVGLSRLLHHAQGAGDTEAVSEMAPKAARAAMAVGAFREAAAFFRIAIDALGDCADATVLEEAAWACYLAGAHFFPAEYQSRVVRSARDQDDPIVLGEALRKLSRFKWMRSDNPGAFKAIGEAISILETYRGPELAQAYSSYSQLLMTGYRLDEVADPAQKAINLAEEFDRPDIRAHALNNLAMSNKYVDIDRGRELMAESIAISDGLDDPDHKGRALVNWMHLEYETCNFDKALKRAEVAAEFSGENELGGHYRYALGMIARAKQRLGLWDDVVEIANRGFDPDDRVPETYNFNGAIALLAHAVRLGHVPDPDLTEHLALYDHPDAEAQRVAPYSEIKAEEAWLSGENLDRAVERLRMVAEKTSMPASIGGVYLWLKRLGDRETPKDLDLFAEPYRLELMGDIAGAARSWAEGGARYDQALALSFGTPEQQEEALGIFASINAAPAAARLSELTGKKMKAKRGRPSHDGPFGLTKRQLDVLRLLGDGLSNAQIGETLFISPKTVDHHVSAILARLEATSRGEATAKARKLSLI